MSALLQTLIKHKKGMVALAAVALFAVFTAVYFRAPDFTDLTNQLTGDLSGSQGTITFVNPKANAVYRPGEILPIKWVNARAVKADPKLTSAIQAPVDLYLQSVSGGKLIPIVRQTAANPYSYSIPRDTQGFYRVALSSMDGQAVSGVFEIKATPAPAPSAAQPTPAPQQAPTVVGSLMVSRDSMFAATDPLTNSQENTLIGFSLIAATDDVRDVQLDFDVVKSGPPTMSSYNLYTGTVQNANLAMVAVQSGDGTRVTFTVPGITLRQNVAQFFYLKSSVGPQHTGVQTTLTAVRGTSVTGDTAVNQVSGLPLARTLGNMTAGGVLTFAQTSLADVPLVNGPVALRFTVTAQNTSIYLNRLAFHVVKNGSFDIQNYELWSGSRVADAQASPDFTIRNNQLVVRPGQTITLILSATVSGVREGSYENLTLSLNYEGVSASGWNGTPIINPAPRGFPIIRSFINTMPAAAPEQVPSAPSSSEQPQPTSAPASAP